MRRFCEVSRARSSCAGRGHASFMRPWPLGDEQPVALVGPLAVAALGLALVLGGVLATSPAAAIAGCPLAAHALALTVVGGDGRVACGL